MRFRREDNLFHLDNRLYRIRPARSLFREHDGIRTELNRIGHVGDFRARRLGILDHGEQHLCRGNDWLARAGAFSDYFALDERDLFERGFEAEVAAAYHDRIRGGDNFVRALHRTLAFNFGDDLRGTAKLCNLSLRFFNIFLPAHVRDTDVLNTLREPETDVFGILRGEQTLFRLVLARVELMSGSSLFPRTCEVEDDGNVRTHFRRHRAERLNIRGVLLVRTPGKVQAHDIHVMPHHLPQYILRAAFRANGRDDL